MSERVPPQIDHITMAIYEIIATLGDDAIAPHEDMKDGPDLSPTRSWRRVAGSIVPVVMLTAQLPAVPVETAADRTCAVVTEAEIGRLSTQLAVDLADSTRNQYVGLKDYAQERAETYGVRLTDTDSEAEHEAIRAAQTVGEVMSAVNAATTPYGLAVTSSPTNNLTEVKTASQALNRGLDTVPTDLVKDMDILALRLGDQLPRDRERYAGLAVYYAGKGTELYATGGEIIPGHEMGHALYNAIGYDCRYPSAVYRGYHQSNPDRFRYSHTDEGSPQWRGVTLRPYASKNAAEDAADNTGALLTPYQTLTAEMCDDISGSPTIRRKMAITAGHFNMLDPGSGDYALGVMGFACAIKAEGRRMGL